jgi:hypothetical protein
MRRLIAIVIVLWPAIASAERHPEALRDAVVADLGLHVVGIGYQRSVGPRLALQAAADYYSPWTQLRADDHPIDEVAGFVLRVRVFGFLHAAPTGWWASPFAQYGRDRILIGDESTGGTLWAAGAAAGYAWLFGHVLVSVGLGVQYHSAKPSFSGVWPHADAIVGYAF